MMVLARFSKRERTLLLITITVVFSTVLYGFIIEPLMEAHSRLSRQIEANILKLEKSYRLLENKEAIEAEYEKHAGLIRPLPSEEEEIASMLKAIESIASRNNIGITNIRPQPVKRKPFYKEFVFELSASADIEQLVEFIYELQTSNNLLRVRKITLSASSSKEKELKAVMEINKPSILLSI